MEELPNDFGKEEDPDDDDESSSEKKDKKLAVNLIESLKEKVKDKEKDKVVDSEEERQATLETLTKEALLETSEEEQDIAPELDGEAPLSHLSREEGAAIAQIKAKNRLEQLQPPEESEELTSDDMAAITLMENILADGGDTERATAETVSEVNGAATKTETPEYEVATETALPVDPDSLLQDARNELSAGVSYKIHNSLENFKSLRSTHKPKLESSTTSTEKTAPEAQTERQSEELHSNIVDYLVGRRYGRMTAEENQEVIAGKLSNEVSQLLMGIASKETLVRQMARNKVIERKPSPRSNKEVRETEVLGKLVVDSELPERPVGERDELAGISAHTMKRPELMKVAGAIKIEGNSLKQIYEAHLLGEKGLRRVVAEYLRGGNYIKALKRELLEREKDFERDPKLRDQASSQSITPVTARLENLLQKNGIDWSEPQPTIEKPKVKAHNLPALLNDIRSPSNPLRRVADVVLIGTILAMATVIVFLLLTR